MHGERRSRAKSWTVPDAQLRRAIEAFVLDALPVVAVLTGGLYGIFAVAHLLVLPSGVRWIMAMTAAVTSGLLFALAAWLRRGDVPPAAGPRLGGVVILLVLGNGLLHLGLVRDPVQTTNLMLAVVGAALLLLSRPWFVLTLVVAATGWAAVALSSPPSQAWIHFGFALLSAIVLAIVIHVVWFRAVARLEGLRLRDEARQQELLDTLAASEAARNAVEASRRELAALLEAMQRSEERFRRFTLLDGIVVHEQGMVLEVNDTLPAMLGYPAEALVGRRFDALLAPESLAPFAAYLERGEGGMVELTARRHDGTTLEIEVTGKAVPYEGRMAQVMVVRDVSDRRRAEAALRDSEARFRQLADSMPHIVWSAAPDGTIDYWNARWAEFLGLTAARASVSDWYRVCHPDDRALVIERWRAAMQSGEPIVCEHRLRDPRTGQWRWHVVRGLAYRDAEGRVLRWFGTITDIDESKRVQHALEAMGRRKDRFLALLAHELRNPLASLRSGVDVLRRLGRLDPRAERVRDIIDRQVRHMTRLIDDLLDFGRLGSGKLALRPEPLDLVQLVATTVEDHRAVLEGQGLQVQVTLPAGRLDVVGDPTRLAQAVGNLLQNAGKFTPGGRTIAVSAGQADAGTAVVTVRDEGIGIEPATLERIFEPFHQEDEHQEHRPRGGLGLGLTLARALVELHGGRIEADSAGAGCGATFSVYLPLAIPNLGRPSHGDAMAPRESRRWRVLVIEDDRDAAESLSMLLRIAGHEVLRAETGTAGIELARERGPDVVLCDIGLPGDLDGYAVARAVRADPNLEGTRLVAVTGYGHPEDLHRARQAGFDLHLTKPVDLDRLEWALATSPGHRSG